MRTLLLAAAALLPLAAAAEPQILPTDAEGAADMLAYTRTDAYRKLLAQALARVPATVVSRCPKLAVEDGAVIIQQPPRLGPNKSVTAGAWRHSQLVKGCGNDVLVSFFFYAGPDRVMTVVGVPGNSRGDLNQQRDARTFVLIALDPVAHGCRQFETVNTKFEAFGNKTPDLADPGPSAQYRPWWETWTMLGCGKRYTVPLNFVPNRLGIAISQPGGIEVK